MNGLYPDWVSKQAWALRGEYRGKLSLQACQDVAQEAFLKVLDRAEAGLLEPGSNVEAYLTTTARNLAIDKDRGERRLLSVEESTLELLQPEEPVERSVEVMGDLVVPAISGLDINDRLKQVLYLQSQGLTDVEIAAALGISADRVHKDRHRALVNLRGRLEPFVRDAHRKTRDLKKDG
ncbi:RNA polymerase sigma factor [Streptomyces sp. SP18CS02]|nr:RNA polymerase sigma factor [Streptomyces sp. SP18CS02]